MKWYLKDTPQGRIMRWLSRKTGFKLNGYGWIREGFTKECRGNNGSIKEIKFTIPLTEEQKAIIRERLDDGVRLKPKQTNTYPNVSGS